MARLEKAPFEQELAARESRILWPWILPQRLNGTAVKFDTVAASHNINRILAEGKTKRFFVASTESLKQAIRLQKIQNAVIAGEIKDEALRHQVKLSLSNSAAETTAACREGLFADQDTVLITNNGTHVLEMLLQRGADTVISAHYTNLHTSVEWLQAQKDKRLITLVPAGGSEPVFAHHPSLMEDRLCAQAMQDMLRNKPRDLSADFAAARTFIDQTYPQQWPTKEADLELIFQVFDTCPVVPLCSLDEETGLIRVVDALS